MKKILVTEEGKNHTLSKLDYTAESELQGYLRKYPDLIPLEEVMDNAPHLVCIGEEVEVPSGYIDLLFIDENGVLTIVETKLAKNPEIRRKVIGQIMEYASHISDWTVDEVYKTAKGFLGRELEEVMREKNRDFSAELFRNNVVDKSKKGEIRLVIAVDEIVETLRTTVTFLNRNSKFDILLLEISSFNDGANRKIHVPLLFGYARKEVTSTGSGQTDETTFLSMCQQGRHRRAIELYKKVKKLTGKREDSGDYLLWGASGYSYRISHRVSGQFEAPLVGYPDGNLAIRFSTIANCGKAGQTYLQRLLSIPSIANGIGEYTTQSEKAFSTDKMTSEEIDMFISALEELGQAQ
ncbi:hypothetical protein ACFLW8_05425 [Chloroflexota bacterium]